MRGWKRGPDLARSLGTTKDPKITTITRNSYFLVVFLVIFVPFVVFSAAQTFRGSITTVEVAVTVTDNSGRLITGLTKDDFEIFEDGDAQPVTQFSDVRTPV